MVNHLFKCDNTRRDMESFWKPVKSKPSVVRQSYWRESTIPIWKQRNDDNRLAKRRNYFREYMRDYRKGNRPYYPTNVERIKNARKGLPRETIQQIATIEEARMKPRHLVHAPTLTESINKKEFYKFPVMDSKLRQERKELTTHIGPRGSEGLTVVKTIRTTPSKREWLRKHNISPTKLFRSALEDLRRQVEEKKKQKPVKEVYSWQAKEKHVYPAEKGGPVHPYYGRNTGHFGTGIYAYTTKKSALRERRTYERRQGETKLIKVEIENPLIVKDTGEKSQGLLAGSEFHSAVKDIEKINPKTGEVEDRSFGGKNYSSKERTRQIIEAFEKQGVKGVTVKELINANKHWIKTGEKQINYILKRRGYGGIYPESEDLSTHAYGAVKFTTKKIPMKKFKSVYEEPKPETLKRLPSDIESIQSNIKEEEKMREKRAREERVSDEKATKEERDKETAVEKWKSLTPHEKYVVGKRMLKEMPFPEKQSQDIAVKELIKSFNKQK